MKKKACVARKLVVFSVLLPALLFVFAQAAFAGGKTEEKPVEAKEKVEETKELEKEAPMLAALVKAGKLPPLEERLPKEPLVT